ncbi:DUF6705 family protein [Chryseobacterium sp. SIMBA_028]|uniref:DUF6705 family protein n=1 Tax=Chryseobacterium sp. SIMBA_028 TaxID=3085771 RepID=UPI00397C061B
MKKIVIILLVCCINSVFAQQVFPLDTPMIDRPDKAYYKDLNGELNQYVGTWKGTWEGKILFLELRKIKKRYTLNDGTYFDVDSILGERKIISANGMVEVDRISNFDENSSEFYGILGQKKNFSQKFLLFQPKDMCTKTANLDINFMDSQKTQMRLQFKYNPHGVYESCPYYHQVIVEGKEWPMNFPKDIVLTKQ